VFSGRLQGDRLEDQDNVNLTVTLHGDVVTAVSGNTTIAIDVHHSYYDPSGSDFKQGIYGTATPGPALVVTPNTSLPASNTMHFCLNPLVIVDLSGNSLAGPRCVDVHTR